ncbi:hypothetical protein N9F04_05760 [Ascidiaceihabitans sp.]|nr:hypothetical protein [Ascidiaceihabitans sp.]
MTAIPIGNVSKTNITGAKVQSGEVNRTQTIALTTAKHNINETEKKADSLSAMPNETSRKTRHRTNAPVNKPNPNVWAIAIEKVPAMRGCHCGTRVAKYWWATPS